jgi:4-oxalomesaconate tautomerase
MSTKTKHGVRCMWMRGGTSKGAYFLAQDLPADVAARDAFLLSVMGSPDVNQIDGIGGAHPLRSKVAIVERSKDSGIDIDFVFAQVAVNEPLVDTSPNCGNILAGVAPFAIERGLVPAKDGETRVRVRTLNTGTVADLVVETPGGVVEYSGETRIDGVPGASAPIKIDFLDVAGSVCGSLLPTKAVMNLVEGVAVTCIDNGMPIVVIAANSLGRTGYESVDALNSDEELKRRLEAVRLAAGSLMGLGDVTKKVVPKMSLLAAGQHGGAVSTRSFIPHACHTSIGVFGAVSVATACVLPGSVADGIAAVPVGDDILLSIEHPTGEFTVHLELERSGATPTVKRAGLIRTARKLFDGEVFGR